MTVEEIMELIDTLTPEQKELAAAFLELLFKVQERGAQIPPILDD